MNSNKINKNDNSNYSTNDSSGAMAKKARKVGTSFLKNLSLKQKLLSGFGLVIAFVLALSSFMLWELSETNKSISVLYYEDVIPMELVAHANVELMEQQEYLQRFLLSDEDEMKKELHHKITKGEEKMHETLDHYKEVASAADLKAHEHFESVFESWVEVRNQVLELAEHDNVLKARHLEEAEAEPLFQKAHQELLELLSHNEQEAKEKYEESGASYNKARLISIFLIIITVLFGMGIAQFIAKGIVNSVNAVVKVAEGMAEGDLTQRIAVTSGDEIGQMSIAINKSLTSIGDVINSIGQNAKTLAAASVQISSLSEQMSGNAQETSAQANVVSAASEEVTNNVQTVATGAEEMSASIKEIARNATAASAVADKAVKVANTTNTVIGKLGESSAQIGQVVNVITSIAEQTNMLALNATIEAARAGEAGKGFAVVASEVKELAKETAKATEDISQKIGAIQKDTESSVKAIGEISEIIGEINDIQNTIATAVEEQSATTNEIVRNVSEAAKGSAEISQNISGVATAAENTTQGVTEMNDAAQNLNKMADDLQNLVSRFTVIQNETEGGDGAGGASAFGSGRELQASAHLLNRGQNRNLGVEDHAQAEENGYEDLVKVNS